MGRELLKNAMKKGQKEERKEVITGYKII